MIIYQIKNKINGKVYVGQTVQKYLSVRVAQHRCANSIIGKAIAKYGFDNFEVSTLARTKSLRQLNQLERYWIKQLNCTSPNGYNIQSGGHNALHTPQTKEKMRIAKANYNPAPPVCTTEMRKQIVVSRGGFKGDFNPFFGKRHSEESKQLIGAASQGRRNTYLAELNKSRKGIKLSTKTVKKMRTAKLAWWAARKVA